MEDERRTRNRLPLKAIMTLALAMSAVWLVQLYMQPTWTKIVSFVLGYLVGTLINEWVHQRSSREPATPS
jgi:predicted benzoate:H+ symporter BenE